MEKLVEITRREHVLNTPPGILYVGPAGENIVRTATVMAKLTRAAGYGGYGSLMGVKKLKAIVVKGNGPLPKPFDPAELRDILYKILNTIYNKMKKFIQWSTTEGLWHCGFHTSSIAIEIGKRNGMKTRNYRHFNSRQGLGLKTHGQNTPALLTV